jgi:hypothetical protein
MIGSEFYHKLIRWRNVTLSQTRSRNSKREVSYKGKMKKRCPKTGTQTDPDPHLGDADTEGVDIPVNKSSLVNRSQSLGKHVHVTPNRLLKEEEKTQREKETGRTRSSTAMP